jgi:asparagine synthase (glutamine-hydrolysing)
MGGVPTPTPELQDLLRSLHLRKLARQLVTWALYKRVPWFHLLLEAADGFFPPQFAQRTTLRQPVPWLALEFARQNRDALRGYEKRVKLFGGCPSSQGNFSTLETIRRQLGCTTPPSDPIVETRYPYLDRNLLQFVFCIPREQLTRPGQRRSLMRRALSNIVPDEILNRRRKGFVTRRLREALNIENEQLNELVSNMRLASFGIVDQAKFVAWLQKAGTGHEFPGVRMARTVCLELWLRSVMGLGIVGENCATPHRITIPAHDISAEQI